MAETIKGSVGQRGKNDATDVETVQKLLNKFIKLLALAKLVPDGIVGKKTIGAIMKFQKVVGGMARPDGRVDPGKGTMKALNGSPQKAASAAKTGASGGAKGAANGSASAGGGGGNDITFKPSGQNFNKRFDAMAAHAKKTYGVTMKAKSFKRKADWQQKYHIAHMLVYNQFNSLKPKKTSGKIIDFDHAANASLANSWKGTKYTYFLRTKSGKVPELDPRGEGWKQGMEPDKAATHKHVKAMLSSAGIGKGGKAMVAVGVSKCGHPCGCAGKPSKHLTGAAKDVEKSAYKALESKLSAAKQGSLDDYLKKFGLHRPMKNHSKSPEPWHFEALK